MKAGRNKKTLTKKDITYVSLDSKSVIADQAFQAMTAEERGVYWTLILYLYANGGSIIFDSRSFSRICNSDNFDNVWEKIKHNFKKRGAKIFHKMVSKELSRTLKLTQARSEAGLKGTKNRWHKDNKAITKNESCCNEVKRTEATRNENKGRETISNRSVNKNPAFKKILGEVVKKAKPISVENSSVKSDRIDSGNITNRKFALYDILLKNLKALGGRNEVTFRNFVNWLARQIIAGKFNNNTIWDTVAKLAEECIAPSVKNPPALFMKKVKEELGYLKDE